MLNKALLNLAPGAKKNILLTVCLNWLALAANIAMVNVICLLLEAGFTSQGSLRWPAAAAVLAAGLAVRCICQFAAVRLSAETALAVKKNLRDKLYHKMLALGPGYSSQIPTAEAVQLSGEGVEQLESYFSQFLPQLFYSILAALTLFAFIAPQCLPAALVLFVCIPLIPLSLFAVQKLAKTLLGRYWDTYHDLGQCFLDNLQGLTTLKIYQTDALKHQEMNQQAERFRQITMKVLTMQLNSISVMDFIAYAGSAAGILVTLGQFAQGQLGLAATLTIILLAADFFIPLRLLGSLFHVSMNGVAAADKMTTILNLPEPAEGTQKPSAELAVAIRDLSFSYDGQRQALSHLTMTIPKGGFVALVGESGCGKSTLASLLLGVSRGYLGSATLGGTELRDLDSQSLLGIVTRVSYDSTLFKGSVAYNLRMGKADATATEMAAVLKQVQLYDFLPGEQGLNFQLQADGANLSGGQRQRLALARALLKDSAVYIFDEATSNIDADSENAIMAVVRQLAKSKTVILISHRLANVTAADQIYVLQQGQLAEQGTHQSLLCRQGLYARLYQQQAALESYAAPQAEQPRRPGREVRYA